MAMLNRSGFVRPFTPRLASPAIVLCLSGCIAPPAALLGETDEQAVRASEVEESKLNTPPVADAGADAVVAAGSLVVLNGEASSDPDGQRLSYIWQQVDGDVAVELVGQYSSFARFEAPDDLTAEALLKFRLLVIDGFSFAADEITVTVQPAN